MVDRAQLIREIEREEGWREHAYQDHLGFWTIGYGFLIDERKGGGLPKDIADAWLEKLIADIEESLDREIFWWRTLTEARQRALINMAYQLGVNGLMAFQNMLAALRDADYATAAKEALDSKWAKQTPQRARRMAHMIEVG
ncbi:MAG: glycoside hydrolase family protein [Sphingomonadales bacterium]|nr:glycoside hydrolase family protein [Sphingomonadales bacterium]